MTWPQIMASLFYWITLGSRKPPKWARLSSNHFWNPSSFADKCRGSWILMFFHLDTSPPRRPSKKNLASTLRFGKSKGLGPRKTNGWIPKMMVWKTWFLLNMGHFWYIVVKFLGVEFKSYFLSRKHQGIKWMDLCSNKVLVVMCPSFGTENPRIWGGVPHKRNLWHENMG